VDEPKYAFDRYPDLHELVDRGGRPGVHYMLALCENVTYWQKEDWDLIAGMPALTVAGPKGEVSMQLMGQGEPIIGATPESWEAEYFIDMDADPKTGLWSQPSAKEKEVVAQQNT